MPNVLPRCFWPQSTEQFESTSSPFTYNIVVTRTDDYILSTQLNLFLQLNLSKSSVRLDSFTNWTRSVSQCPPKLPSGPSSKGMGSASLCHRHFTKEPAPELSSSEDGSWSSQPSPRIEVALSPPLRTESEAQWASFHEKQKREGKLSVY